MRSKKRLRDILLRRLNRQIDKAFHPLFNDPKMRNSNPRPTSQTSNTIFLTRDYTLIKFLKENHEDISKILDEKKFLEKYE